MPDRKIILILGLSLLISGFTNHTYSQTGFVFRYSTPEDEYPSDIIETSDGGFLICASIGSWPITYQTLFIRLNKNGDTVFTKKIIQNQGTCYINHFVKLDNGTFMGVGEKKIGDNPVRLWLLTLSDSLKIISDTSYLTGFWSFEHMVYSFINHFRNVIVYGSAFTYNGMLGPFPYVFKFSQTCDSLFSHCYTNPWGEEVFSMMEKSDNSGYLMSMLGSLSPPMISFSQFVTIDYSFNITHLDSIPADLDLYLNTKTLNDLEFLVTGKKSIEYSNPRTDKIGILKLDSTFHIKKEFFFGPNDTVSYPAYNTNLDFLNVNNIFLGGVANQDWGGVFSYADSYILLGKLDSSLNLTWRRYFGGDSYYMVWSVIATTDGGCIIGATTNDLETQGEERDIYILKVDSSGLVTGINNQPPVQSHEAIVYPNPGDDLLYVETQLKDAIFHLFDLTGREVQSHGLFPGRNSIQVSDLNSGLYVYKIIQKSQVKEYGKWINQ